MKKLTAKDFKIMFSNLCCSRCKNEFTIDSIEELKRDGDLMVCKLICQKCFKDFGEVILNYNRKSKSHTPLEIIEGAPPISIDEIIDVHNYLKNKDV